MIQLHTLYFTHNLDIHPPLKLPLRSLPTPLALVAPSQPQYIYVQKSIYSGYKKVHGHKMETVFSNKIGTCFGPGSTGQNDQGTLNMSSLDCFLVLIQAHLPPNMQCMLFDDSVFRGNLQMIKLYFWVVPPDVLTPSEIKFNAALRVARMPIKKKRCSKLHAETL
jgi:hypothetical protein